MLFVRYSRQAPAQLPLSIKKAEAQQCLQPIELVAKFLGVVRFITEHQLTDLASDESTKKSTPKRLATSNRYLACRCHDIVDCNVLKIGKCTPISKSVNNTYVGVTQFLTYEPHDPNNSSRLTDTIGPILRDKISASGNL